MDATLLIELAKEVNISQLLCTGLMIWFFYSRLDKKIEKLDKKFSDMIDNLDKKLSDRIDEVERKLSERIDKIDEKFTFKIDKIESKIIEVDRRIFTIETMLHMRDCCMLKDDRQSKKVE